MGKNEINEWNGRRPLIGPVSSRGAESTELRVEGEGPPHGCGGQVGIADKINKCFSGQSVVE